MKRYVGQNTIETQRKVLAFKPLIAAVTLHLTASSARAQSAIPWQTPFENLIDWMSNDTAKWVLTLVIIGAGLAFAVGESGGFFRRCAGAVLGGAIAINAATWAGSLFGW